MRGKGPGLKSLLLWIRGLKAPALSESRRWREAMLRIAEKQIPHFARNDNPLGY
ncbi:MAG: hypothetical protein JSS87_13945 [Acidobacteria bacterium]|nr:hypothetical protein [Acidobacteriota bacterium]